MHTRLPLLVALLAVALQAQRPVIYPGGVVNGATFAPAAYSPFRVAAGCIASIFGSNLAAETRGAASLPLPTSLAGTSVTFDGVAAPLFYVSPGQVNVQVPSNGGPSGWHTFSVVVTTLAGSSDPEPVGEAPSVLGIFTLDSSGCGRAAVFNVAADGSMSLNSPNNSVSPGGMIAVWGTGLGYEPGVTDGEPPGPDARPVPPNNLTVQVPRTGTDDGWVQVQYAARAPLLVGVDQLNLRLPDDTVEACNVPLAITVGLGSIGSQKVPVAVHRGGGACGPAPPPDSLGVLTLVKTVATGISPPPPADSVQGQFTAAVANKFPTSGDPAPGAGLPPGPPCSGFDEFETRYLDAGRLRIRGPAPTIVVRPATADGQTRYDITLRPTTIQPGAMTVSALGGADIGPCDAALQVGRPIHVTSPFPPGTVLNRCHSVTVTWTGGDPDSIVRAAIVSHLPPGPQPPYAVDTEEHASAPASAGTIVLPTAPRGISPLDPCPDYLPVNPGDNLELLVSVDPPAVATFSAAGLTLGVRVSWQYQYRFGSLKMGDVPAPVGP
jgi:uncharacterized protein (TIGR03437 family)